MGDHGAAAAVDALSVPPPPQFPPSGVKKKVGCCEEIWQGTEGKGDECKLQRKSTWLLGSERSRKIVFCICSFLNTEYSCWKEITTVSIIADKTVSPARDTITNLSFLTSQARLSTPLKQSEHSTILQRVHWNAERSTQQLSQGCQLLNTSQEFSCRQGFFDVCSTRFSPAAAIRARSCAARAWKRF